MSRADRLLAAYRVVRIFGMLSLAFMLPQAFLLSENPSARMQVIFLLSLGWIGVLMGLSIVFDGIRSLLMFSPLKTIWLSGLLLYLTLAVALFGGGIYVIGLTAIAVFQSGFLI